MVTTNQNSTTDTHTNKKKQSKHNTKDSHQVPKEEKEEGKKKITKKKNPKQNKFKTVNKMAIRAYISIITLEDPTKRCRLAEWVQK